MQDVTVDLINEVRAEMRKSIGLTPDLVPAYQDADKYPILAQEIRNMVDDLSEIGLKNDVLDLIEDLFVALVSMIHRANAVSPEKVTKVPFEGAYHARCN